MKRLSALQWIGVVCGGLVVVAVSVLLYQHVSLFFVNTDDFDQFKQGNAENSQALERDKEATPESLTPSEALARLVKIRSRYSRTSFLFKWLAEADKTDLIELLRNSENVERNAYRTEIQTATTRKLATLDPDLSLRWIFDQPRVRRALILTSLFREWSQRDLDEAIEGAKSTSGNDRKTALEAILSTRSDLATNDILDIASELELKEVGVYSISASQTLELLEDPALAWEALLSDSIDNAEQLDLLKLVASAWEEREGFDVLLQAARLFPTKDDRSALSTVITGAVGNDIKDAFAWLLNVPLLERGELPCALAMVAARIDPELAIGEIAAWSGDPVHVQLEKTAANTWAQTNPRAMLDKIEMIPQSARVGAMELALTRLAYEAPEEAIEYMEATKGFVRSDTHFARTIAQQWSYTNPEAALEWAIAYSGKDQELLDSLRQTIFRNLVRVDFEKALDISRNTTWSTLVNADNAAEYDVIWELTQMGKIDDAIALLPQVHEQARYFAINDLGKKLVRAGDPFKAIELGAQAPAIDAPFVGPVSYFDGIFSLWATRNPQQLFDTLPSISSPMFRSIAAKKLIDFQDATPALTEEQFLSAQNILSEHPLKGNIWALELKWRAEEGLIDLDQLAVPDEWLEE